MVIPLGFEPKTHSLEGCCSIQLSYGTISTYEPYQYPGNRRVITFNDKHTVPLYL